MSNNLNNQEIDTQGIEFSRKIFLKVLAYWYWFALSVFLAFAMSWAVNRYTTAVFEVKTSLVKLNQDENESLLSAFSSTKLIGKDASDVERDLRLIKSKKNLEEAVRQLDFSYSIFSSGEIKTSELYPRESILIEVDSSSKSIPYGELFELNIDKGNNSKFRVKAVEEKSKYTGLEKESHRSGEWFNINGCRLRITITALDELISSNDDLLFKLNSIEGIVMHYMDDLAIEVDKKSNNIFHLYLNSKTPEKDYVFLNKFLEIVRKNNLSEKNRESKNSLEFIDDQLNILTDTLSVLRNQIDNYRIKNLDFGNASELILDKINELEVVMSEMTLKKNYYDYILEYVEQKKDEEVFAPIVIGIEAPVLNDLIKEYIEIKKEAKLFKNNLNEQNPYINYEESVVERIELNIVENVENLILDNDKRLLEVKSKIDFYIASLRGLQEEQRDLYEVNQLSELNTQLVELLLQKKTELGIQVSSNSPDYAILDEPEFGEDPIVPNKIRSYLISLIIGIGIPFGIIFIREFSNKKIELKEELLGMTTIPFLGVVGHSKHSSNLIVIQKPKSSVSESFRSIRSGIQYLHDIKKNGGVFLITSSISGEGKTFCSINLSQVFSLAGSKVLLIGADMRKPKIFDDFEITNDYGLSSFLAGQMTLKEAIQQTAVENLDILASGPIPPNPSELLMGDNMNTGLEELRKMYDVVIIDSPPHGLVTDAMIIMEKVDQTFYITRQGITPRETIEALENDYHIGKIKNISLIFNDLSYKRMKFGSYRYGYGYSYGYYDDDQLGFFQRLYRRLSR